MMGQAFLVAFCLYTGIIGIASPKENNETVTVKQLKGLEETLSEFQKHIVAQDQKQTAVLSSVLSMLTDMKDDFAKLQHNYTILEKELSSLNCTSVEGSAKSFVRQRVAFEATMAVRGVQSQYKTFNEHSTLIFPTIQYNEGGCWSPSTGVFTASVNGTYLFWIFLTFTDVDGFSCYMKRNDKIFGASYGHGPNPTDTTATSRVSITQLIQGDTVRFLANKKVKFLPNVSSCGGVLLHSDVQ